MSTMTANLITAAARRTVAAASAVALCVALAACGGSSANQSADDVLRIGSTVEPANFDPAATGTAPFIPFAQAVYDSLLKRKPDGTIVPFLASAWEYNDDETELTLTLEPDVQFSDGVAFDSSAVKANLEHFQNFPTPSGPLLRYVASVETPDESTVVLKLSASDPSLLLSLAGPAGMMGSPESLGTESIEGEPVGTGPYTLDTSRSVRGSEYVFQRKDDYWGEELPYREMRFLILSDETARLNALKSGQINAALILSPSNAKEGEAAGLTAKQEFGLWEGLFFFDRDGALAPPLEDPRVREALRISIDAEAIVDKIYLGEAQETGQIFPQDADAYVPELDKAFNYDPDRARDLLEAAGYGDGFEIRFPRTPSLDPGLYTAIEQYWNEIGVNTKPHAWSQSEAIPSMQAAEFPVSLFRNILLDSWSTVNFAVTPEARYNPFRTKDAKVAEFVEQMQLGDSQEQKLAGQSLNEYLVEQVWFGPLYRPAQFLLLDGTVTAQMQPSQGVPSIWTYQPVEAE